jgi:hypothetical protein
MSRSKSLVSPTSSATLAAMRHYGAFEDRETYLNWAFCGNPPDELDPEEEAELPVQFQRWTLEDTPPASKEPQ